MDKKTLLEQISGISGTPREQICERYYGRNSAQPAYVEIDTDGITLGYNAEIGNSRPIGVWEKRVIWISIDPFVDLYSLERELERNVNSVLAIVEQLELRDPSDYDREALEEAEQELESALGDLPLADNVYVDAESAAEEILDEIDDDLIDDLIDGRATLSDVVTELACTSGWLEIEDQPFSASDLRDAVEADVRVCVTQRAEEREYGEGADSELSADELIARVE